MALPPVSQGLPPLPSHMQPQKPLDTQKGTTNLSEGSQCPRAEISVLTAQVKQRLAIYGSPPISD